MDAMQLEGLEVENEGEGNGEALGRVLEQRHHEKSCGSEM